MISEQSRPLLLTIDDESFIRSSISAYFEDCGFDVIEAADGHEGMKVVRSMRPDCVITDLRMPRMDGMEVVDAVRKFDDNLPVIVLSGTGVLSDAVEAVRRGAWDYLSKPVQDLVELELVVARCLERARLVRDNRGYHEGLEVLVAKRTAELRKFSTAVEQSANTVIITNFDGIIEYVNPKFEEVTGFSLEEARGQTPRIIKSNKYPLSFYQELWKTIRSGGVWRGEFCNVAKDGREFWEYCTISPLRDDEGNITHFVGIKEDIAERKRYEERLFYQANHDLLTGLPNRYYLQNYLEHQLIRLGSEARTQPMLLLDIDNLKFINDTFGHKFGDQLFKEIARRLVAVTGSDYMVSRFLGDEFVVLPSVSCHVDDVHAFTEMIRGAMNKVFVVNDTEVVATASIGVVYYPEDGEGVDTLLKNAEAAMYQAKKNGRNTAVYYSRDMHSRRQERMAMEARLHQALERDEFVLKYQPQISLVNGGLVGMEALLRWVPKDGPPVMPDLFIPLLEESGLIVPVGEWVLETACAQCMAWQKKGLPPLTISVNISALQFIRSDLDETVARILEETGLDHRLLCLELTESMIMIDSDRTLQKLRALKDLEIRLSLDDFGTGYSSMEYLGRLPINEIKIDKSFVMRMTNTKNDAVVVNTIVAMGHGLGMELVAEGVETEEQLEKLIERRCQIGQGYLFSPPLTADEFDKFIVGWDPEKVMGVLK